jgi:eukaryotic-like serine/threonine-protein kinase
LFCDSCGGSNRAEARFCRVCGSPLWLPDPEPVTLESTSPLPAAGSPPAAPAVPQGARAGDRYVILGELNRGGMGVVYAAHDPVLDRNVAVKVLRRELSEDAALVQRFLREARIAAALRHPNVVSIHDIGRGDLGHFFVMDFIDGRNLAEIVEDRGYLPLNDAKRIVHECARAVAFAHNAGVLHRDLKPENVMLDNDGHVVVLDFGLARAMRDERHTRHGGILGSPRYMSPEQLVGQDADVRCDVFSVGLLFYYLLVGRALFDGESLAEIRRQHDAWVVEERLAALEIPLSVIDILRSMLARKLEDRLPDLLLAARFEEFRQPW